MFVCLQVGSVRGRGSSGPAGSGSGGSRTISGPVQPVALFHQLEQQPLDMEDADAEAEAPVEVVDPKVQAHQGPERGPQSPLPAEGSPDQDVRREEDVRRQEHPVLQHLVQVVQFLLIF